MPEKEKKLTKGGRVRGEAIKPEEYEKARFMWENDPNISFLQVAKQTGIAWTTVKKKAELDRWVKKGVEPYKQGEQAILAANLIAQETAKYGPDITPDQRKEALDKAGNQYGVDIRTQVLLRHQREWAAVRSIFYDTLRKKEYGDRSKLAKIASETLQIIQANERKAYGIVSVEEAAQSKVTIVIEREKPAAPTISVERVIDHEPQALQDLPPGDVF